MPGPLARRPAAGACEETAETFAAALLEAVSNPRRAALVARRAVVLLEEHHGPRSAVDMAAPARRHDGARAGGAPLHGLRVEPGK